MSAFCCLMALCGVPTVKLATLLLSTPCESWLMKPVLVAPVIEGVPTAVELDLMVCATVRSLF